MWSHEYVTELSFSDVIRFRAILTRLGEFHLYLWGTSSKSKHTWWKERLKNDTPIQYIYFLSRKTKYELFQYKCGIIRVDSVQTMWTRPKCFISEGLTAPTKLTNFLYFIVYNPSPPCFFGWDQQLPIPFNCQQVPLLHVMVSDVLKATG